MTANVDYKMSDYPIFDYPFDDSDSYWENITDYEIFDSQCSVCSQIELILRQAMPPILLIIGIPGNILTLTSMSRLSSEAFPLCGYLCLISCLDIVLLFVETGNDWFQQVYDSQILNGVSTYSDTMCKLNKFGRCLVTHHDVWILVSFAIECNVLVNYPRKIKNIISRRVLDTLAFISVVLICANCHYFWTYGMIKEEITSGYVLEYCNFQTRTLDGQLLPGTREMGFLWTTLDKILATISPTIVFIILLVLYTCRRRHYHKDTFENDLQAFIHDRQCKNRENQSNGLPYDRHGVRLNAAVISELIWYSFPALCFTFLICHVPVSVHAYAEQQFVEYGNPDAWALTGVIFNTAKSFCHSCKIVVYAASSKVFRNTVKVALTRKWNMLRRGCTLPRKDTSSEHVVEIEERILPCYPKIVN